MSNRLLTHLRHVDLAVPDYDKQLEFYGGIFGLTVEESDDGIAFLAAEGSPESFIIRLRRDDVKRLDLIAWGAASVDDVDTLAARLGTAGVTLVSEPGKLDTPGGGYGFRFFDNDGRTVEVSADVAPRAHRRIEAKESIPVRLSHVVVCSEDIAATRAWYEEHLNFAVSDTLTIPDVADVIHFMRINQLHHSMGLGAAPHTSVHHISFELRGIDEFMRGAGRLLNAGHEMVWGPGRHLAGDNTFAYFMDPHGNQVEYTTALEEIDEDTWHPHVYSLFDPVVKDQWGTANKMTPEAQTKTMNDPDPGVFVAPPV